MTPERIADLVALSNGIGRESELADILREMLDEIGRLAKERDALLAACVREYRNGPTRWRVRLPAIWPEDQENPAIYAPGDWDLHGEHWCFDNRDDAVAAVRRAAGIGEDAS